MKIIIFLTLLSFCLLFEPAIKKSVHEKLQNSQLTWQISSLEENKFSTWSFEQIKSLLKERKFDVTKMNTDFLPLACSPPDNFDARTKFTNCVHSPMDQKDCGSCWAFSIAEMMSDRFCISGKNATLSPQFLTSCDLDNDACNGGSIYTGMQYAEEYGIVSEECFPYGSGQGFTPLCPRQKCPTGMPFTKFHCKKGSVKAYTKTNDMKCALLNGPLASRFEVYEDFLQYKSGVYKHETGEYVGGHAIKILGWGVENGTDYWLCENSWGDKWGMDGFFKIKQGDSDIAEYMIDCEAEI